MLRQIYDALVHAGRAEKTGLIVPYDYIKRVFETDSIYYTPNANHTIRLCYAIEESRESETDTACGFFEDPNKYVTFTFPKGNEKIELDSSAGVIHADYYNVLDEKRYFSAAVLPEVSDFDRCTDGDVILSIHGQVSPDGKNVYITDITIGQLDERGYPVEQMSVEPTPENVHRALLLAQKSCQQLLSHEKFTPQENLAQIEELDLDGKPVPWFPEQSDQPRNKVD